VLCGGLVGSGAAQNGAGSADGRSRYLIDVVKDVVRDFAPEELPLVDLVGRRAGAGRGFVRLRKRNDPLGLGLTEAVALATPVVWTAVKQIADRITTDTADSLYARGGTFARRVFRRKQPPAALPHFGDAELKKVRSTVEELAGRAGMDSDRAELLADAVVGRLKLGDSTDDTT
jgi:hypothetical protein